MIVVEPDLARAASLIAEPSRAAMLAALLGGRALPATELARAARVTPQTASAHLQRLRSGGLVVAEPSGRHRYFRLASQEVANLVEALARVAPRVGPSSVAERDAFRALRFARSCYDHLAGRLGVALSDAFERRDLLRATEADWVVTPKGRRHFERLDVEWEAPRYRRRALARKCLDWSERRPHLAGALGAALLARMLELDWLFRRQGGRGLEVTRAGDDALRKHWGVSVAEERRAIAESGS